MNLFDHYDNRAEEYAMQYFEAIKEFYAFLSDSITPEDYKILQCEFEYTESYDEHISGFSKDIPSEETSIEQIKKFLNEYVIFQNDLYIGLLKKLNHKVKFNQEECKNKSYLLMKDLKKYEDAQSQTIDSTIDSTIDDEGFQTNNDVIARQNNTENGIVRVKLGNSIIELKTHNNPLLTSLYSILLSLFSVLNYGVEPTHI